MAVVSGTVLVTGYKVRAAPQFDLAMLASKGGHVGFQIEAFLLRNRLPGDFGSVDFQNAGDLLMTSLWYMIQLYR